MIEPPPLRNDCFALPAGVEWTPVDQALDLLRARLSAVTGTETVALEAALGRVLAEDAVALRSNPPLPNSAVDGYGFAGGAEEGAHALPLQAGRAAAGLAFAGRLPNNPPKNLKSILDQPPLLAEYRAAFGTIVALRAMTAA